MFQIAREWEGKNTTLDGFGRQALSSLRGLTSLYHASHQTSYIGVRRLTHERESGTGEDLLKMPRVGRTWLEDTVEALSQLGGKARWTDLANKVVEIREGRGQYAGWENLQVSHTLWANCDGRGRALFTKPSRGIYELVRTALAESFESPGASTLPLEVFTDVAATEGVSSDEQQQSEEFASILTSFETLVFSTGATETLAGDFLKDQPWILGAQYHEVHPEEQLGLHGRTDFLAERSTGWDLIELKSPSAPLFVDLREEGMKAWSETLKNAVSQMMHYLSRSDILYLSQQHETHRSVLHPEGIIVVGRSLPEERDALRIHGRFLNQIQILTYDHLIADARSMLSHLRASGVNQMPRSTGEGPSGGHT